MSKTLFEFFNDWLWRAMNHNISWVWFILGVLAGYFWGFKAFILTLLVNLIWYIPAQIAVGIYREKEENKQEIRIIKKNIDS
jgi:hypothetical protein